MEQKKPIQKEAEEFLIMRPEEYNKVWADEAVHILTALLDRLKETDPGIQTGDTVYVIDWERTPDSTEEVPVLLTCEVTKTDLHGSIRTDELGDPEVWNYELYSPEESRYLWASVTDIGYFLYTDKEKAISDYEELLSEMEQNMEE
jgi:hypothetical protein